MFFVYLFPPEGNFDIDARDEGGGGHLGPPKPPEGERSAPGPVFRGGGGGGGHHTTARGDLKRTRKKRDMHPLK